MNSSLFVLALGIVVGIIIVILSHKSRKKKLRTFAHDVRNPLSIIKMNCEVMLLKNDLSPEIKKMLESNIEESNRASQIVSSLFK